MRLFVIIISISLNKFEVLVLNQSLKTFQTQFVTLRMCSARPRKNGDL